jgi:ABC-type sugar transport system substrate-binding protein
VEVIVRVKNGATYATVDLQPAGQGADGTITLMVISSRGAQEVVRSLVEGC